MRVCVGRCEISHPIPDNGIKGYIPTYKEYNRCSLCEVWILKPTTRCSCCKTILRSKPKSKKNRKKYIQV